MNKKCSVLSVILLLVISSCSNATQIVLPQQVTQTSTQASSYPYPAPANLNSNSVATSYPNQEPTEVAGLNPFEFAKTIAPSSDQTGLVRGKLIIPASVGGFPGLYLGSVLNDNNNNPGLSSLDKASAPKANFDSLGNFVFLNVKPGKYVLFVDFVERFLLLKNTDGSQLLVSVEGGKTIDLGELKIPEN